MGGCDPCFSPGEPTLDRTLRTLKRPSLRLSLAEPLAALGSYASCLQPAMESHREQVLESSLALVTLTPEIKTLYLSCMARDQTRDLTVSVAVTQSGRNNVQGLRGFCGRSHSKMEVGSRSALGVGWSKSGKNHNRIGVSAVTVRITQREIADTLS